ncbi:MAG: hypothetical protein JST62_00015 [Bacteroidetes bacterium]|nr:hypothetical protein [Bacteroidota bacterium]
MDNNNNNQIARIDSLKMLEIIDKIPNLTDGDKHELAKKIASDDIEIRKSALEKMTQSSIAHNDLVTIMGELSALNKEGMYVKSKQTIRTGSGTFEIESKGGDTKLIIPVLVIVAIVIIAILVIMFWRR